MQWAVTSSKAKKVRWSQWQTVPSAPSLVEQPLESQSPVGPGGEERGTQRKGRTVLRREPSLTPWEPTVFLSLTPDRVLQALPLFTSQNTQVRVMFWNQRVVVKREEGQGRGEGGSGDTRPQGSSLGVHG